MSGKFNGKCFDLTLPVFDPTEGSLRNSAGRATSGEDGGKSVVFSCL